MRRQIVLGLLIAGASLAHAAAAGSGAPNAGGSCPRPAGNTGTGLYVACSRVNNPDGSEFRIRGVNRAHSDQSAAVALNLIGANAARNFEPLPWYPLQTSIDDWNRLIANRIVPIQVAFPKGTPSSTCSDDVAALTGNVNDYVGNKTSYQLLNKQGIINIANEWGPQNSAAWRDSYITAIRQLRAAGLTMPLMIDTGQCGQDAQDILVHGAAVAASDPQKNIILSFHLYGNTPDERTMRGYFEQFAALAQANPNLAVVIGEFGPGRNVGPSPTTITPLQVIADAEASNLGWIAWAWDDNNLADCKADDNSFDMTTGCFASGAPSTLTKFGQDIVGQLKATGATRAKVFK